MAIRHKKSPRSPSDGTFDPHSGVNWHEDHVITSDIDFRGFKIINYGGSFGGASWGDIAGTLSDQEDLQTALDGKSGTSHNHDAAYSASGHNHNAAYAAISHGHAISDVTNLQTSLDGKAATAHTHSSGGVTGLGDSATRNVGTGSGDVSAGDHTHAGGSDPWTYLRLSGDFTTTSATAVDITGLGFAVSANQRYEFEAQLMLRTATATVNPRAGLAWPTGMTDGVGNIDEAQSATAILMARGNINASLLVAVGGIPNTTQSWPCTIWGMAVAGSSPSGNIRAQIASETAGTAVRVMAGSFIKYRTIP